MPRSSTAAKPHSDVFLTIVFQSHLGQPNVETAIGSRLAGFDEPMEGPATTEVASLKRSRRVIFRSYGIRSPHTGCVERARRRPIRWRRSADYPNSRAEVSVSGMNGRADAPARLLGRLHRNERGSSGSK